MARRTSKSDNHRRGLLLNFILVKDESRVDVYMRELREDWCRRYKKNDNLSGIRVQAVQNLKPSSCNTLTLPSTTLMRTISSLVYLSFSHTYTLI